MVRRILVVDDCEGSRTLLADLLGMQGYRITTAPDGVLAWRLLQQSWVSYSLVITDLLMSTMNGIELLEKIRAAYPGITVVLVTGHLEEEITSSAHRLGAFAVLPKPCGLETLYGTIKRAFRQAPTIEGDEPDGKVDSVRDRGRHCGVDSPERSVGQPRRQADP